MNKRTLGKCMALVGGVWLGILFLGAVVAMVITAFNEGVGVGLAIVSVLFSAVLVVLGSLLQEDRKSVV